jgi:hypothetical protein
MFGHLASVPETSRRRGPPHQPDGEQAGSVDELTPAHTDSAGTCGLSTYMAGSGYCLAGQEMSDCSRRSRWHLAILTDTVSIR